jgi:glycosyltransferase involved in cell wall biosynthesis
MSEAFFDICPQVQHSPFLLFISRLDTKKGVDLLIEAYSKVFNGSETVVTFSQTSGTKRDSGKAEVEAGTPKLVIAGPGLETEYGQGIQRLIAERELTSSVFFTGMLTGNAKWGAFYNSDAFVLPSHQENFGIAVVEALACSKPVLISNKINIFREIQAGGGGYVADDTLEGVIQLLSFWKRTSLHDKEEMAKRSRNVYFKNFAVAPVAKQLMASLV